MASSGGTFTQTLARSHLDPRPGGTVCDQGPPVGAHLAGPAPSVARITGTCVPALRGPGSVCPAQTSQSGVQKGEIAHLGRQKPLVSELAVAAHRGASQRHTTCAVMAGCAHPWVGEVPHVGIFRVLSVTQVQNKTKQNKTGFQKGQIAHLGRQKPLVSELAVAAHGGASQRHTTCAVYGRLCAPLGR